MEEEDKDVQLRVSLVASPFIFFADLWMLCLVVGPMLEAFGYERIIFGTSSAGSSTSPSHAGDWYEIVRESLAELGLEQAAIDSVFSGNAKVVYGQ